MQDLYILKNCFNVKDNCLLSIETIFAFYSSPKGSHILAGEEYFAGLASYVTVSLLLNTFAGSTILHAAASKS